MLCGRTNYGDSIEDEWVIVYILRELTRQLENLWVKVTDSDGQFLLVEAAATLPPWLDTLEPDMASNRVWIHQGDLIIIKPGESKSARNKVDERLTFRDAREIILTEPKKLMRSTAIEEEAFYRLRNYPDQINKNMHSSLVTVPRTIAYLLHLKPGFISPAVEAFYIRDPVSLRALRSKDEKLMFPPEDLIIVSIKFTKAGFAQLRSQDFEPPARWKRVLPSDTETKEYSRVEMGMKLTCGFEMLLSDPQNRDKPVVREMKMLMEDINTGDEQLPSNEEIEKAWEKREDDETWLDINYEDLEKELSGRKAAAAGGRTNIGDFGDKAAQENLQRMVSQFEKFLNDESAGFEGAELVGDSDDSEMDEDDMSSDGEDVEMSFDEEEFSAAMKEMMGLPPPGLSKGTGQPMEPRIEELESGDEEDAKRDSERNRLPPQQSKPKLTESEIIDSNRALREELYQKRQELTQEDFEISGGEDDAPKGEKAKPESKSGSEDEDDEELREIQMLSDQMEAELKRAGVLDPNRALREETERKNRSVKGKETIRDMADADESDAEEFQDSNVDINLARNLLESLRSQGGGAGPGSNLLGLMGMQVPKQDRE